MVMVVLVIVVLMVLSVVFGVMGFLKDGLQFLENLIFIIVVSYLVIEKNFVDLRVFVWFFMGGIIMCGIFVIVVSFDRCNLVVVEIVKFGSIMLSFVINVYVVVKFMKRCFLMSFLVGFYQYVLLCFICDGKYIVVLGGLLEW